MTLTARELAEFNSLRLPDAGITEWLFARILAKDAARALRTIAASEVLLAKKITTQDLSTDGPAVAAELRKQAAGLRARADQQSAKVNEEAWGLAIFDPNRRPAKPELTEWPHP